jgi:hypothetical protein
MHRVFLYLLLSAWLCFSVAYAQYNNFPPGVFGGRAGFPAPPVSYTGPGDIKSAGAVFWVGLRAYSAAYAAAHGNVVRLCNSSGASCTTVTANTNGTITLPGATACGGSACTNITTLYDQTGNGNDLTQATAGNMPTLVTTQLGGLPTAFFVAANSQYLQNGATATLSPPLSFSLVYDRTADSSWFGYFGVSIQSNGANVFRVFDGSNVIDATASDSAWHAVQAIDTGSGAGASQVYVDNGTITTGTFSGSGTASGHAFFLGTPNGGSGFYDGYMAEFGFWNSNFISPDVRGTMCHNQFSYWGTSVSC